MNSSPDQRVLRGGATAAVGIAEFDPIETLSDIEARAARDLAPAPAPIEPVVSMTIDPYDLDAAVNEGFRRGYETGHAEGLRAGRAEGYLAGHEQGVAAGQEAGLGEAVNRVIPVIEQIEAVRTELQQRDAVVLDDITTSVVDLAIGAVRALLDRELAVSAAPARDAIARALRLAPERRDVSVRVHPDDAESLGELDRLAPGRAFTVVYDPAVERGGAVVEVGSCSIDAQVSPALERVIAALRELELS
jgi:flagellar assembly protein FliH